MHILEVVLTSWGFSQAILEATLLLSAQCT